MRTMCGVAEAICTIENDILVKMDEKPTVSKIKDLLPTKNLQEEPERTINLAK